MRTGLRLGRETGADYVVCLHADGQYPPEKLPAFIGHMAANGIDVLQGSRHLDGGAREGGMPAYKIVAGKVLTRAFDLSMTDYHSGFPQQEVHAGAEPVLRPHDRQRQAALAMGARM